MTPDDIADNLTADLRLIRTSWEDMLPPFPKRGIGPTVRQVGKAAPPPAPIGTLSLRRQVCEVLASWCQLVAEERDLHPGLKDADGPTLAGWLMPHVEWLAGHEAADAVASEVGRIAGSCDAIAREVRRSRVPIGPCVDHQTTDLGERVPCPGTLVAYLRSDQDLLPSVVACDADSEHSWEPGRWSTLGRRLGRQFDEQATRNLLTWVL